jgi:putative ABC transport system permease protein
MTLKLIFRNLWTQKLSTGLSVLLMAFGVLMASLIVLINQQLEGQFSKNLKGIDMVVGAKGSPLQLILSSVFQIDNPTGNIKLSELNQLKTNPMVKELIPISMGDNHMGFRIIGSTEAYLKKFGAEIEKGRKNQSLNEVIIGSDLREVLKIDDRFQSAHGLDKEGEKHAEHSFKVVGTLKPSGTVIDKLIICDLNSIWAMHHEKNEDEMETSHTNHEHAEMPHEDENKEVTAALVQFRSPLGMMSLPRTINANTNMMSALPSIEVNRLFEIFGIGLKGIRSLAIAIILISGLSVFVSLYNSLKERSYEIALLKSMGASRLGVFMLLLGEGLTISLVGFFLGWILSGLGIWVINSLKLFNLSIQKASIFNFQASDFYLFMACIGIGFLAALLPAAFAYRLSVSKLLAEKS